MTAVNIALQEHIFPVDSFRKRILIIGAGGTGSWLAFFLIKCGIPPNLITVVDKPNEKVEERNLGSSLYRPQDVGKLKIDSLSDLLVEFGAQINTRGEELSDNSEIAAEIVFFCLDNNDVRGLVFDACIMDNSTVECLIDIRASEKHGFVYCFDWRDELSVSEWREELTPHAAHELEQAPCKVPWTLTTIPLASRGRDVLVIWYRTQLGLDSSFPFKLGDYRFGPDIRVRNTAGG